MNKKTDIIVFCGPTITAQVAAEILPDVTYLAPAKQGDIYRAMLKYHPKIIALIDGNFENIPSPWHKEILYALDAGIKVFGSSSMGALRAAELHSFGMIGVGRVFELFKSGFLEDDDEVAIIHGPERLGYPYLSEAMVNIRHTLEQAYLDKIISGELYKLFLSKAKITFYKKRKYSLLIKEFEQIPNYREEVKNFSFWLNYNRHDIKRDDAIHLLKEIKASIIYNTIEKNNKSLLETAFQSTIFWQEMQRKVELETL